MMLLVETIKNSSSAIQKRRAVQESKKSAEDYTKALGQLARASDALKDTLTCASELQAKGLVERPLMPQQMRDELLECANACGKGVFDGTLSADMVTVLRAKSDIFAGQIGTAWKDAAKKYSEGTKGYLSMIGGLSEDPKHAIALADNITKTAEGAPSVAAIKRLVADVTEAKKITEAFSLNPEIERFLKKVSLQQATIFDLTPNILAWLKEKNLTNRLKIRF